MVVAAAHHGGLRETGVDVPADELACREIHGAVRHGQDLAGGAGGVVAFQIVGGIEPQLLVQHVALAVQVEVAVVGEVDDGVRVRRDAVIHAEGVIFGEGVAHRDLQIARETVLAVGALGFHEQGVAEGLHPVKLAGESAVQVVLAVVLFQLVGLAAHAEHSVLDAVGVTPHKSTAAGAAGGREVALIVCHGVVAQNDIHRAVFGRYDDIFDDAAVIQDMHRQSAGVGKDVLGNVGALFGHTEGLGADLCHWAFASSVFSRNTVGQTPTVFVLYL